MVKNKRQLNTRRMHTPYYKQKNKNNKPRYKETNFIKMIKRRRILAILKFKKLINKKKFYLEPQPTIRNTSMGFFRSQKRSPLLKKSGAVMDWAAWRRWARRSRKANRRGLIKARWEGWSAKKAGWRGWKKYVPERAYQKAKSQAFDMNKLYNLVLENVETLTIKGFYERVRWLKERIEVHRRGRGIIMIKGLKKSKLKGKHSKFKQSFSVFQIGLVNTWEKIPEKEYVSFDEYLFADPLLRAWYKGSFVKVGIIRAMRCDIQNKLQDKLRTTNQPLLQKLRQIEKQANQNGGNCIVKKKGVSVIKKADKRTRVMKPAKKRNRNLVRKLRALQRISQAPKSDRALFTQRFSNG